MAVFFTYLNAACLDSNVSIELKPNAIDAAVCLSAFQNDGSPVGMDWYRVTSLWQENTAGLNSQPGGAYVRSTTPAATGWHCVHVTSIYNSWRTGNSSSLNHGFIYVAQGTNNQFNHFRSSDYTADPFYRPTLYVNSATVENKIVLKWPLAAAKPVSPTAGGAFGDPWGTGITKCVGKPMTHTGVNVPNAIGNPVYAMEDGFVKEVLAASQTGGWAAAIVLEHNRPGGGKYTTVSWHVNPLSGIVPNMFVPKGMQIATIADISTRAGSHLHIGVRIGSYNSTYSDKGALPTGYCSELATFKENFINAWDPAQVLFQ